MLLPLLLLCTDSGYAVWNLKLFCARALNDCVCVCLFHQLSLIARVYTLSSMSPFHSSHLVIVVVSITNILCTLHGSSRSILHTALFLCLSFPFGSVSRFQLAGKLIHVYSLSRILKQQASHTVSIIARAISITHLVEMLTQML